MEFTQARVDGNVPAFWTESGDEMTAGLVFRVGMADEQLARRGITHLIEHLALYPLGPSARMHYNGQVDAVTTWRPTELTWASVALASDQRAGGRRRGDHGACRVTLIGFSGKEYRWLRG